MIDILRDLVIYGGGAFCVTSLVEWLVKRYSQHSFVHKCWSLGVLAAWLAVFVLVMVW